ncbi:hypothetical protein TCSYLVIO_006253 [Trypanosoma cruzi]|uniref:AN1-type domain-containing protein n=2 Tax=Trypanosoma cruzi TaxID=5693 RepID=V5AZ68_TRYCR|nr:hypothetical protein TCSYLVIO_006253 [Trypanosoma cruzi]ESS66165.1 hypothetical protein TCDM_05301 [Trypanosoma cruzi Dm28c]PBJ70370.1 hypothetical protein BCY84_18815 [Trypanosoma cruzi cruzi]PWV01629.1 hypothetical protein C4B63_4g246 [Trypanosoma cruzi]RNF16891.1 AN1-type zinc finger protein 2B [Trypanosoma cruzi]
MQVGVGDDESKRCNFQGCTQVDPLASRCVLCGDMFCANHTSVAAHMCRTFNAQNVTCPLCHQAVSLERSGQPIDEAVSRHIDRGCRPAALLSTGMKERTNHCSYTDCRNNAVASIICEDCGNRYCIEHRAPARHQCRKARTPAVPALSQVMSTKPTLSSGAVSHSHSSPQKNFPRNTPSTAFGTRAEGTVTPLVLFAKEFGVSPFFMHFSRLMVVGRALDLAVGQATLDSAAVGAEKGTWVLHVVQRPHSADGFSVVAPPFSATLKTAGVMDGSIVYIGKKSVQPDDLFSELAPHLANKFHRGKEKKCAFM